MTAVAGAEGEYRLRGRFGVLAERDFRLLFGANAVSVVGDLVVPVALAFAVLDLTHSASALGLVLAARVIPMVVFVLAGGVWADRLSRRRLMINAHLVRFASQGLLGALLVTGTAEIWHLVALQALHGAATGFYRPATIGLTAEVVDEPRLQQANSLLWMTTSAAGIIGPAIAGILVATAGSGWAILLDALTFLAAAALLARLRTLGAVRVERQSFLRDLASGWREVGSRTWVWGSILAFMLYQLFILGPWVVLGPLVAKESLGGASAWATIVTATGVGAVLGGVLAMRTRPRRPLVASSLLMVLGAPSLVLLGTGAPTLAIAATEILTGLGLGFALVVWETTLQRKIPRASLSRVSGWDYLGSTALRPVGLALAGPLAAAIGVRTALLVSAGVLVVSNVALAANRSVRSVEGATRPSR